MAVMVVTGASAQGQGDRKAPAVTSISVAMPQVAIARGYPKLIPEFEQKTGIKVNLLMLPEQEYEQKIMLDLGRKGSAYDVVWATKTAVYKYASEGWIEALEPFIDDPARTDAKEFQFQDLVQGAVDMLRVKGKLYGLPTLNATIIMYYRKDIFRKFGIDKVPATWAEMEEVCRRIHTPEVAAIGLRANRGRSQVMWPFPMVAYSFGAQFLTDYLGGDFRPTINSPQMVQAITAYSTLLNKYGFRGSTTASFSDLVSAMQQGKVAILVDGAPLVGQMLDPEKSTVIGKLGFARPPAGPSTLWPAANAHGLTIPVGSRKKDAAWEFMKWALSRDVQIKNALTNNETALTRTSVIESREFKEKFNYDDGGYIKAIGETFAQMKPYYQPDIPEWREAEDYISAALSEIITNVKDPRTALNEANAKVDEIFRRAGYYK